MKKFLQKYRVPMQFLLGIIVLGGIFGAIGGYASCQNKMICYNSASTVPFRDVFVVLDQSASMKFPNLSLKESQLKIKETIVENIFDKLGIGDRITAFRIDACFYGVQNKIISSPRNIPLLCHDAFGKQAAAYKNAFIDSLILKWNQVEILRDSWKKNLDTVFTSAQQGKYSDYHGALAAIEELVAASREQGVRDIWVIVIGDLEHHRDTSSCPDIYMSNQKHFKNVTIRMLYPAGVIQEREELVSYWKKEFKKRGGTNFAAKNIMSFKDEFKFSQIPLPEALERGKSCCPF